MILNIIVWLKDNFWYMFSLLICVLVTLIVLLHTQTLIDQCNEHWREELNHCDCNHNINNTISIFEIPTIEATPTPVPTTEAP